MGQKKLLKTIFGKETGITKKDLEEQLSKVFRENDLFECKRIENESDKNKITQELVAFLNKIDDQGGILALGVDAPKQVPTKMLGVKEQFIKDKSALRNWAICNIWSIPKFLEFPDVEIESVDITDTQKVYLIEIHPKDKNVLYYCKISNCAYKREVDTTKVISLEETTRLIENKKVAKIFVNLEPKFKVEGDFVEYRIKIVLTNKGNMPGFYVTRMFLFNSGDDKSNIKDVEISFSRTSGYEETTSLNTCLQSFQKYTERPLYPSRPTADGYIDMKFHKERLINLVIEIDETKGRSQQSFSFAKDGMQENIGKKLFFTYVE